MQVLYLLCKRGPKSGRVTSKPPRGSVHLMRPTTPNMLCQMTSSYYTSITGCRRDLTTVAPSKVHFGDVFTDQSLEFKGRVIFESERRLFHLGPILKYLGKTDYLLSALHIHPGIHPLEQHSQRSSQPKMQQFPSLGAKPGFPNP